MGLYSEPGNARDFGNLGAIPIGNRCSIQNTPR